MKRSCKRFLLFLLLVVFLPGCAAEKTRPWVDLREIDSQVVRKQGTDGDAEGKGAKQPAHGGRVKDMSSPGTREHEFLKKGPAPEEEGRGGPGDIMLNFDNADVYEFIQVISETLGINYIVDPKVKGTVNVRSGQGIHKDQLFGVFRKILHINGLDVRNEGNYYYIHPAKGGAPQQVYGPKEAGALKPSSRMVIQIIPVVHLSSAEAQKLIEPYLSEVGVVHNLPGQNTLIVSDFEGKVLDMASVLARLDISPLAALKVRLIRVEHAPLFALRDELQEILTAMAINAKEHDSVSIIPLERVNSLLLISKSDQLLDSTDRWIKELDAAPTDGQETIHFYNVRNSVASDLASLVNALILGEDLPLSRESASGRGRTTDQARAGLEQTAGLGQQAKGGAAALFGGETPFSAAGARSSSPLSSPTSSRSPLASGSGTKASSATTGRHDTAGAAADADRPATAGKAESLTSPFSRQRGDRDARKSGAAELHFAGEPMLIPDDSRNVILIRALMPDYTRLVKLLERLDNMPRQVLIEVLVAEVTLNDSWEFGVEWALKNNKLRVNGSSYQQKYTTAFESVADVGAKTNGFVYSVLNSAGNPIGLLNALAAETDVSLLSSPQVLVLNNEEALVNVGDQIPIITSESVPTTTTDLRTSTVQYKDTGTILKVIPRINHDGMIILDIDQQVSSASENTLGGTTSPIISTRELKTKLAVKDGQTIMMGGLIKKGTTTNQNKVPLLGDVPLLGWAFKYEKQADAKTELLVMITPYVIETDDVLAQYIKRFQEKMQGLRKDLGVREPAAASAPKTAAAPPSPPPPDMEKRETPAASEDGVTQPL
ncbi:MAG: type II secretion system secretin GspD [Thermodesulfobacteriota bacterium]